MTDETWDWLIKLSQENRYGPLITFQQLLHKREHRDLYFMLLEILLPAPLSDSVNIIMRLDRTKWQLVNSHEFEGAARAKHQFDTRSAELAAQCDATLEVTIDHVLALFDRLKALPM